MMKDDLSRLLETWTLDTPEPVEFRRKVWHRIEAVGAAKNSLSRVWWKGMFLALARPQMAVSAIAIAMLAGAWIGHLSANPDGREGYVRSVNPFAQGASSTFHANF